MDGKGWFRAYRLTFYLALFVWTVVRLYLVSGFGPELADRARGRLGGFDVNRWLMRIGSAAFVLTLAAAAAILAAIASHVYGRVNEDVRER